MGIAGLSIAFQRFATVFAAAHGVGVALLAVAYLLFATLVIVYGLKFFRHRPEVIAELKHPVRANFFPAISIGLLLLGIATLDFSPLAAKALWLAGSLLHLGFSLFIIAKWITSDYEIAHSNPTWFIPVVGNILVPIAGVELAGREVSWFFFSVGIFFWVALFTIVFYRLIFHHQLAQKFIPTLFILIAPPAVGFVAYVKLTGGVDPFARILFYVALFFVLLLASMFRHFFRVRFFVSWWAYTFPLCAVTIATTLAAKLLASGLLVWVAGGLLAVSTAAVALVSAKTIEAVCRKTLCEAEE